MSSLVAEARRAPGASNAELAKALGVTPSYVSQLLAEGKKTGRLSRRKGKLVVGGAGGGKGTGTKRRRSSTARRQRGAKGKRATTSRRQAGTKAGSPRS
jgi:hypothetical protein